MRLWVSLYLLVWVAFLEFVVAWAASSISQMDYVHAILGVVTFAVAYSNFRMLGGTNCPARIKRIVKATVALSAFAGVLGILLFGEIPDLAKNVVDFLHLGAALAIITQAASTATAYDMWEEKEFS